MKGIGNEKFNSLYEANLLADYPRPNFTAPKDTERPVREKFIKAKYSEKRFIGASGLTPDELSAELYSQIATGEDAFEVFKLVAQGANLHWLNPDDEMKGLLHCAVIFDKLASLEILIQNGGDVFQKETRDWSPMHYASYYHRVGCAVILHYHGFTGQKQLECKDWENKTAVELAFVGKCEGEKVLPGPFFTLSSHSLGLLLLDIVDLLTGRRKVGLGFTVEDLEEPSAGESEPTEEEVPVAAPIPIPVSVPKDLVPSRPVPQRSLPGSPSLMSANAAAIPSPLSANVAGIPSPMARSPRAYQAALPSVPVQDRRPSLPGHLPFIPSHAPTGQAPASPMHQLADAMADGPKRHSAAPSRGRGRGRGGPSPGAPILGQRHSSSGSITPICPPVVPPKPPGY